MRKGLVAAILAMGVLAQGCGVESSQVDPKADVTISGKLLGVDGKPLASSNVLVLKELDAGEILGGLFVAVASLGLACLDDTAPAICAENAHRTVTGSDGGFSLTLRGSQTQGSLGLASTMEFVGRGAAKNGETGGPSVTAEFRVQVTSLQLPDARLWHPDLAAVTDKTNSRLTWSAIPESGFGDHPTYRAVFSDARGSVVWLSAPVTSPATLDARLLEDVPGSAAIAAYTTTAASGTTVEVTHHSASLKADGRAGAPPSRGAACSVIDTKGKATALKTCPLTDGDMANWLARDSAGTQVTAAVIDLATTRSIGLLVVRGCVAQCVVSGSADGTTYEQLANVHGDYTSLPLAPARPARYLKVTGAVSELREVSAW